VVVIDVRPQAEFEAAHLPFARSLPLAELEQRINELPLDADIVAYCRGPFCVMSDAAVKLLLARGYRAKKTTDGVSEWLAAGLPVEQMGAGLPDSV
jgi:rhodanese-related sulfurtransferase